MHKDAQTRHSHIGICSQKCHWAGLCFLGMLLGLSPLVYAKTGPDGSNSHWDTSNKLDIRIVAPKNTRKGEFIDIAFNTHSHLNIDITRSNTDKLSPQTNKNHIIITVGAIAFHEVLRSRAPHALIMATYISETAYFKVLDIHNKYSPRVTAIFSDIPLDKQIRLAKILIPQSTHLTTLLGDHSLHYKSTILKSAHENDLEGIVHYFENRSSLNKLFQSDVFKPTFILTLPDPRIFNASSLRHILLKGYRNNISVIGPNEDAVSAGSLASIYFPSEEFAHQSQKIILDFRNTGIPPNPKNLKHFNFVINQNVAKSMNINIPPDTEIQKFLGIDW